MKATMYYRVVLVLALVLTSANVAGQSWNLTGNSGTNQITNFLGTTDNQPLIFKTSNNEAMRININGNVGIGTVNPVDKLEIEGGPLTIDGAGKLGAIRFRQDNRMMWTFLTASWLGTDDLRLRNESTGIDVMTFDRNTNYVGIGTVNPVDMLEIEGGPLTIDGGGKLGAIRFRQDNRMMWTFLTAPWLGTDDLRLRNESTGNDVMTFDRNTNYVGIGTTNPTHTLDVRGTGITFRHTDGNERAFLDMGGNGQYGVVATLGPNGGLNAALIGVQQSPNHGAVAVFDDSENVKAYLLVDIDGRGFVVADVKSFRVPYSKKNNTDIMYACIEGPEAAVYVRGTARLVDGKSVITFPDHFLDVASEKGMTVQLTPLSANSLGLGVVEKNLQGLVVKELHGGKSNYEFDWEVKAIRKGYEDYKVIRSRSELMMVDH